MYLLSLKLSLFLSTHTSLSSSSSPQMLAMPPIPCQVSATRAMQWSTQCSSTCRSSQKTLLMRRKSCKDSLISSTVITAICTCCRQREYCVDYEVLLPGDAISLADTEHMYFYVIFIKVYNDTLPTTISSTSQAFLSLGDTLDYIIQLTTGENLYLRESYRTMSHAFSIYLPSMDALEKLQEEPSFLSVLNDQILPIAQSYAIVSFTPFLP